MNARPRLRPPPVPFVTRAARERQAKPWSLVGMTSRTQTGPNGAVHAAATTLASSGIAWDRATGQRASNLGARNDVNATSIPAGPDQVNDAWLTAALRASAGIGEARVLAHTTELLELQGAAAVVARLTLQYDHDDPGAPASLIAKFATSYEPIRALMSQIGGYAREVEFYRLFGADPGIPIPRCYHAEIDPATGVFALLLEDMSDARPLDGTLLSEDDIELAVRHLAPFHAKGWAHPRLSALEFLHAPGSATDAAFMAQGRAALAMSLPQAKERFGAAIPAVVLALAEHMLDNWQSLMGMRRDIAGDTLTLVHGDFHPGQIFFPSGSGGRFAVFDWQTVSAGNGGDDLARIMTTSLPPDVQARCDRRLVELYHGLLLENGVRDYDLQRCYDSYRQGLVTTAIVNVIASVSIDPARIDDYVALTGIQLAEAMFGWVGAALEAHGAAELMTI